MNPLVITLFFTSIIMRSPMGAVGPLLPELVAEYGLTGFWAGNITTIPLFMFALASPFAGIFSVKFGPKKVVPVSLSVILIGILVRSFCGVAGLYLGTVLVGLGTGVLNVSVPAFIKTLFKNPGPKIGLYSSTMAATSGLTATLVVYLNGLLGSWKIAMAAVGFFGFCALVSCLWSGKEIPELVKKDRAATSLKVTTPRNIVIAIYMGLQSLGFFSILSWLPTMMDALNPQFSNIGIVVLIMQLASIVPSYLIPVIANKKNVNVVAAVCSFLYVPGILLCSLVPTVFTLVLGVLCIGFSTGSCYSMGIMFCTFSGETPEGIAKVTAFGQFFGYLLAALGPSGIGLLFDITGSWLPAVFVLVAVETTMAILALVERRLR